MKNIISVLLLLIFNVANAQLKTVPSINGEKITFDPNVWKLTGNIGTLPASYSIGTIDDQDFILGRNGRQSVILGANNLKFSNIPISKAGMNNIAFGSEALKYTTGHDNVAVATYSQLQNTTGSNNVSFGINALGGIKTGSLNVAIGSAANGLNSTGSFNVAIGYQSLYRFYGANGNIAIGNNALGFEGRNNNTVIGDKAISTTYTETNACTVLGGTVGFPNIGGVGYTNIIVLADGANKKRITVLANGNVGMGVDLPTTKLTVEGASKINGDFSARDIIAIDPSFALNKIGVGTTSPTTELDVRGNAKLSGSFTAVSFANTSDERLKRNVKDLEYGLEVVTLLKPVSYEKKTSIGKNDFTKENGFIAQEVRELLPDLVSELNDNDKTLAVNYIEIIPLLTKAIQEQQVRIQANKIQIARQKVQIGSLLKSIEK